MSGGIWKGRKDDEALLRVLHLRMTLGAAEAGRWLGMKSEKVRTMCNRVLNEDLRVSVMDGVETPKQVLAGYWEGA
ncbi:hypothetical protein UFOVP233_4 [uncultured Caudovirales phage]|uniref:Uncharacterized protein n=1 Tax=uncultured Caudovirales phage TaxID=2100421 RepID=A0A6J7WQ56_9CAUD|nr:hypothetical protein UFOVP233_4 [uncultured Caudovirales phage]